MLCICIDWKYGEGIIGESESRSLFYIPRSCSRIACLKSRTVIWRFRFLRGGFGQSHPHRRLHCGHSNWPGFLAVLHCKSVAAIEYKKSPMESGKASVPQQLSSQQPNSTPTMKVLKSRLFYTVKKKFEWNKQEQKRRLLRIMCVLSSWTGLYPRRCRLGHCCRWVRLPNCRAYHLHEDLRIRKLFLFVFKISM